MQLAREIAVPGQDRAQHREPVERGVRRQKQDQHRCGDDEEESRPEVGEHGVGELSDGRLLDHVDPLTVEGVVGEAFVDQLEPGQVGQDDDTKEHRHGDHAEQQQGGCCVLAFGLAERRNSVGDCLYAGQRCASRGERTGQQRDHRKAGEGCVLRVRLDPVLGAVHLDVLAEHQDSKQSVDHHDQDREHEAVGGDREQGAGLPERRAD